MIGAGPQLNNSSLIGETGMRVTADAISQIINFLHIVICILSSHPQVHAGVAVPPRVGFYLGCGFPGGEYIVVHGRVLIVFVVQLKYGIKIAIFVPCAVLLACRLIAVNVIEHELAHYYVYIYIVVIVLYLIIKLYQLSFTLHPIQGLLLRPVARDFLYKYRLLIVYRSLPTTSSPFMNYV